MFKRILLGFLLTCTTFATFAADEPLACREVPPRFSGIAGKTAPDVKDVMALGQLGGTLCPTVPTNQSVAGRDKTIHSGSSADKTSGTPPSDIARQNELFARGMEHWNRHEYDAAAKLLNQYLTTYPDGLWAGEAELHLGCEARFNGRYNEADRLFSNLLNKFGNSDASGNRRISDKTTSRLAVLRILENNSEEASELFGRLAERSDDWRLRTYAHGWLQRISQMKQDREFLADCGYRALETLLANRGGRSGLRRIQVRSQRAKPVGFGASRRKTRHEAAGVKAAQGTAG